MATPSDTLTIAAPHGTLNIQAEDEVALKLALLFEGLHREGSLEAVTTKYGYTREYFYELLDRFNRQGSAGLCARKTGPKTARVRNQAVVKRIILHRFQDPEVSVAVIAQRLRQQGYRVTIRSIERTITEYGLQKKTLIGLPPTSRQHRLKQLLANVSAPE